MKKYFLLLFPGLLLSFAALTGGIAGYRINLTSSMPLGIWKESKAIHRGSYVAACLPSDTKVARLAIERGYLPAGQCPGGIAPLLKQIGAIPGDTVTLTDEQIWINEILLHDSRALSEDSAGRPLFPYPRGTYQVPPNEYWLFATNLPKSFDSRYFGPVPESSILTSLVPVATFEPREPRE